MFNSKRISCIRSREEEIKDLFRTSTDGNLFSYRCTSISFISSKNTLYFRQQALNSSVLSLSYATTHIWSSIITFFMTALTIKLDDKHFFRPLIVVWPL